MSSSSSKPKLVLVTGANGYIGSSLILSLLQQGYRVRGTLRENVLSKKSETDALMGMPNASTHLELVPLELEGPEESFTEAVRGAEWVFHTASPVSMRQINDEQTIIGPAVNGTLYMLRAASVTSSVVKFIMTSSIAAILGGSKKNFTEDDWAEIDSRKAIAYSKSKKLAEEAAWKFMEDEKPNFALSVINPGIVLGPVPSSNARSSTEIVERILKGGSILNIYLNLVDIRDVINAHIQAAKKLEAAGKRFILVQSDGGQLKMPEISAILKKEFGPIGYEIRTIPTPNWIVWLLSWVIPEMAGLSCMFDELHLDNSRSREVLELIYIPMQKTIVDCGHSLIEHGIVPRKEGYRSRTLS